MSQHSRAGGRAFRVAVAAGVVALIGVAGPSRGQNPAGQNPVSAQPPKFALTVAAVKGADDKAMDEAKKYLASLKDEKNKAAKDDEDARAKADPAKPPLFPNKPFSPGGPTAADIAAAAAIPPIGIGEGLLAAAAADRNPVKTAPDGYRWVRLAGERELFILGLDASAKADPERKELWEEAEKARKDGDGVYAHKELGWIIFTRAAKIGTNPEYYLMVYQPEAKDLLTHADIEGVRAINPNPEPEDVVLTFKADAKGKLKAFTEKYKAGQRFMILVVGDDLVQVFQVTDVIDNGRMRIGSGLKGREQKVLHDRIKGIIPQ